MKPFLVALIFSAAALTGAHAAEEPSPAWNEVKLKPTGSAPKNGMIDVQAPQLPAVTASAPTQAGSPAATTGIPPIPAAGAPAPALAVSPTASVPAATAQQLPAGLQAGQPAKQYATLEAAAQAGVNPLRVMAATPAPAEKAFEPTDRQAYLTLARKHLGPDGPYIALGGLLVILFGVAAVLRRGR